MKNGLQAQEEEQIVQGEITLNLIWLTKPTYSLSQLKV